jgi:hypothetical protein
VLILPKRKLSIGRGRGCNTDSVHRSTVHCLITIGGKFIGKQEYLVSQTYIGERIGTTEESSLMNLFISEMNIS